MTGCIEGETKQLMRGAVIALPATFHELLIKQKGNPLSETKFLSVARLLFTLAAYEQIGDQEHFSAAGKALHDCVPSVPPSLPAGKIQVSVTVGGTSPKENQQPFNSNDPVALANEIFARISPIVETGTTPIREGLIETITRANTVGALSSIDVDREAKFHEYGEEPSPWSFWVDWRRRYLKGEELSKTLAREISNLPRADWGSGPEHVARKIENILRLELEERLRKAEAALSEIAFDRLGIGGNRPPESLDSIPNLPDDIGEISDPIQELKHEAKKPKPDRGKVEAAISRMTDLIQTFGKWGLDLIDTAAKGYANEIGKVSAKATAIYVLAELTGVVEAAKLWLTSLF